MVPDENEIKIIAEGNTDNDSEQANILTTIDVVVNVKARLSGVRLVSKIKEHTIVVIIPYYFF